MATRRKKSSPSTRRTSGASSVSDAVRAQLANAIANRLELMRSPPDERPVSQATLAEILGLTKSRISQLLGGNTEHYSLERLMDIATQLGLTVRVSVTRPYTHT